MPRPLSGEYNTFYENYIQKVTEDDPLQALEASAPHLQNWLNSLEGVDIKHAYAPGKWMLSQVLQHMIDTERVFAYRAMCIGRGELQHLPGFDENRYAQSGPAANRKLKGLAEELTTLRKASIILFRSLEKEGVLTNQGIASNHPVTVNAIGFILVGHTLHHMDVINEKYLKI